MLSKLIDEVYARRRERGGEFFVMPVCPMTERRKKGRNANKTKKRTNPKNSQTSQGGKKREVQVKKAISVTRLDSSSLIWLAAINIWPRLYRIGDTAFLTSLSPSSSSIIEPNEVGDCIASFINFPPLPAPRSSDEVLRDSVPTTLRRKLENEVLTDSRLWSGSPEAEVVNWSS